MEKRDEDPHIFIEYIFIIVGIAVTFAAYILLLLERDIIGNITLSIGVSLLSVSIINYIYQKGGGDPVLRLYNRLLSAIPLLEDQKKLGVLKIYRERVEVNIHNLNSSVSDSEEIDILSNVMRKNWTANKKFMQKVEEKCRNGSAKYRFLCYEPNSEVLKQRRSEERDIDGRMNADLNFSIREICKIKKKLREKGNDTNLELRLVNKHLIRSNIVRTSKKMFVSLYLTSTRGSDAPTIELDSNGVLYKVFEREFETLWNSAEEVNYDNY